MLLLTIYWEFFKIGISVFGGGLSVIPFLFELANSYSWFSEVDVSNMVAIAEMTPGPVAINMATFAGFKVAGIWGALLATIGLASPSLLLIIITAKYFRRFAKSKKAEFIFQALYPMIIAFLTLVVIRLSWTSFFDSANYVVGANPLHLLNFGYIFLLILLIFLMRVIKASPLFFFLGSGLVGLLWHFL